MLAAVAPVRIPVVHVVDDDKDVLGSLRFLLETEGFSVRTFRSPEALLSALASEAADCFVIDYKMPGMSGIDLAGALRRRAVNSPVILITGYPDESIPVRAKAAGILRVLIKPHVEASLSAHIREAIEGNPPQVSL